MRYTLSLIFLMLAGSIAADDLRSSISADYAFLEGLYRHFHEHPEISFQEVETAKRVGDEHCHVHIMATGVHGKGVLAVTIRSCCPAGKCQTGLLFDWQATCASIALAPPLRSSAGWPIIIRVPCH